MQASKQTDTLLKLKLQLMRAIQTHIRQGGLTQTELSVKLGTPQCRISHLMNNRTEQFKAQTLIKYLFQLGVTVDIDVSAV